MEIILVPETMLLLRRSRVYRSGDVLKVIRVAANQTAHAFRPQRGYDARGAAAPIVTGEHRALDIERIHQFAQIVAKRGLLTGTWRIAGNKARRAEAAQIRHDHPALRCGK